MLTEERFSKILMKLDELGSVSVQQLMIELNASESTIRRDLNTLAAKGKLTKVHGGAILNESSFSTKDDDLMDRKELNIDDKTKIAKYAASLIEPNDFVFLDAGSTTEQMINFIDVKATFVTNALTHAKRLADKGIKVFILGGEMKAITQAIVGEEAICSLEKYNFTKGFFGTNAVSAKKGFTTPEVKEAMVKKKAMENCKSKFVLADSSKFGQISNIVFSDFEFATVITTNLEKESYKKLPNVVEI